MRQVILVLLLLCQIAYAQKVIGAEESLAHTVPLPELVLSDLSEELNLEASGCTQSCLGEALEATKVHLTAKHEVILIKPKVDAWCLCGAYYCPMWIYELTGAGAKRIWSVDGTSIVTFLNIKDHGYRRIKAEGGTASHGFVEIWAWNGEKYVQTSRKDWVAGQ